MVRPQAAATSANETRAAPARAGRGRRIRGLMMHSPRENGVLRFVPQPLGGVRALGLQIQGDYSRWPVRGERREQQPMSYLDYSGRDDVLSGGTRMIPLSTPAGTFRVWTKRIGNNPDLKLLLLHGGPGATHEYLEAFDSYLPAAGVEYYYYDQLGSGHSDQPDEPSLWELDRFVDEVEQVRRGLGLDRDNLVLYGSSWGGILAIEYA